MNSRFSFVLSELKPNCRRLLALNCYRDRGFRISNLRTFSSDRVNRISPSNEKNLNTFCQRTHTCGELTARNVGDIVSIYGWLQFRRTDKFLVLRDAYGLTQVIIPDDFEGGWEVFNDLPYETVVNVSGKVVHRPEGQSNRRMATGDVEVEMISYRVVGKVKPPLPFEIRDYNVPRESYRLMHRYLDLRRAEMQEMLRFRSDLLLRFREFLSSHGFVDVETPSLFRRTPGGAQEFVVPTRIKNKFFSLVQSPQQFKQLLMVGGVDRYYQVARCYRDEAGGNDRQSEFTQLDLEMSFASREDVMSLTETLLRKSLLRDPGPFPVLTYEEVMDKYGTDKPDLRFGAVMRDVTKFFSNSEFKFLTILREESSYVKAFLLPKYLNDFGSQHLAKIRDNVKSYMNMKHNTTVKLLVSQFYLSESGTVSNSVIKKVSPKIQNDFVKLLGLGEGDLGYFVIGESREMVNECLGKIRIDLIDHLTSKGIEICQTDLPKFLWVVDFPLFEECEDGRLESGHHPFTAVHPEDERLLRDEPARARSLHYDLVLDGSEVGGGSVRIHDPETQRYVLEEVLGEDTRPLNHLMEAFECGCPPHAGIALGLDRLVALLLHKKSIRDVIAFPKSSDGDDPMSKAPSYITDKEKLLYHLPVENDKVKIEVDE